MLEDAGVGSRAVASEPLSAVFPRSMEIHHTWAFPRTAGGSFGGGGSDR